MINCGDYLRFLIQNKYFVVHIMYDTERWFEVYELFERVSKFNLQKLKDINQLFKQVETVFDTEFSGVDEFYEYSEDLEKVKTVYEVNEKGNHNV